MKHGGLEWRSQVICYPLQILEARLKVGFFPEEMDGGDNPGGIQPIWIRNPMLARGIDQPEIKASYQIKQQSDKGEAVTL
jgi:hypothetical protein